MNIFISSNMLDLLELADATKARPRDRESPLKQQRFNVLLAKLRERNLHNEAFIRRFRQKAAKRKLKFPEITPRLSQHTAEISHEQEEDQVNQTVGSKCILPLAVKPKEYSQKTIAKVDLLKETNHTMTEDASSDDEKAISFPNLDFCPQENSPSPRDKPRPAFANLKQDKEFNKYLRHVFFKEISTKIESKNSIERQSQGQWKQGEPRRSMGRMKTEMASSKYKLNIKSLIFGSMDPSEGKSQQKIDFSYKPKRPQIAIDRFKNMQRYQRDVQFQDDKLSSKGLLPTIHNHQVTKNKRFLENYIKYNHHERTLIQPTEVRTISLANSETTAKNDPTPNRIGLSLRIQTISVQKCS